MNQLIRLTDAGFYCPAGDFYIDPIRPVKKAVITHAHADHAQAGHQYYLAHPHTVAFMQHRLGKEFYYESLSYHEEKHIGEVSVVFYPSGHVPGGAQVLLTHKGQKWLITGDYKLEDDGLAAPFESVACDVMLTESTFGLPIFNWTPQDLLHQQISQWWEKNQKENRPVVLAAYAFGKAQRLLKRLDENQGPIYAHGAIFNMVEVYRSLGFELPKVSKITPELKSSDFENALIMATPSAMASEWGKRFKNASRGMASGWMQMRGSRRRPALDSGFVLSDHADWKGLLTAIKAAAPQKVYVYHGFSDVLARYLQTIGLEAEDIQGLK